jgi:hypothetical protein
MGEEQRSDDAFVNHIKSSCIVKVPEIRVRLALARVQDEFSHDLSLLEDDVLTRSY